MKKLFKKVVKNKRLYDLLKQMYYSLNSPKDFLLKIFYFKNIDIKQNENFLNQNSFDISKIKKTLIKYKLSYYDKNLSWHHHLFAGLSQKFSNVKILEIGTYDGSFANFLSKIFKDSKIFTCDLPVTDQNYLNYYNRSNKYIFNRILKKRKKNLNRRNIKFLEINSNSILKHCPVDKFDLIWIDGDHLNPQVSNDILNCLKLLKKGCIMCCDDILMNPYKSEYVSMDSYKTLLKLEKNKKITNSFIIKRARHTNIFLKKFISYSKKI
jgi:predicted O-methyltransferase YrrM